MDSPTENSIHEDFSLLSLSDDVPASPTINFDHQTSLVSWIRSVFDENSFSESGNELVHRLREISLAGGYLRGRTTGMTATITSTPTATNNQQQMISSLPSPLPLPSTSSISNQFAIQVNIETPPSSPPPPPLLLPPPPPPPSSLSTDNTDTLNCLTFTQNNIQTKRRQLPVVDSRRTVTLASPRILATPNHHSSSPEPTNNVKSSSSAAVVALFESESCADLTNAFHQLDEFIIKVSEEDAIVYQNEETEEDEEEDRQSNHSSSNNQPDENFMPEEKTLANQIPTILRGSFDLTPETESNLPKPEIYPFANGELCRNPPLVDPSERRLKMKNSTTISSSHHPPPLSSSSSQIPLTSFVPPNTTQLIRPMQLPRPQFQTTGRRQLPTIPSATATVSVRPSCLPIPRASGLPRPRFSSAKNPTSSQ